MLRTPVRKISINFLTTFGLYSDKYRVVPGEPRRGDHQVNAKVVSSALRVRVVKQTGALLLALLPLVIPHQAVPQDSWHWNDTKPGYRWGYFSDLCDWKHERCETGSYGNEAEFVWIFMSHVGYTENGDDFIRQFEEGALVELGRRESPNQFGFHTDRDEAWRLNDQAVDLFRRKGNRVWQFPLRHITEEAYLARQEREERENQGKILGNLNKLKNLEGSVWNASSRPLGQLDKYYVDYGQYDSRSAGSTDV